MSNKINDHKLWAKVKRVVAKAGREVIEKVLLLYYAAQEPGTPLWAKGTIYGALSYFIMPLDAIPDLVPGGYVDDLGVLAAAVATVSFYINQNVKNKAAAKLQGWFG